MGEDVGLVIDRAYRKHSCVYCVRVVCVYECVFHADAAPGSKRVFRRSSVAAVPGCVCRALRVLRNEIPHGLDVSFSLARWIQLGHVMGGKIVGSRAMNCTTFGCRVEETHGVPSLMSRTCRQTRGNGTTTDVY